MKMVLRPQERPPSHDTAGLPITKIGFLSILTWKDYYELRQIPLSSPVALLLTFPLTLYHAIATFGHVPVTVARMLKRPLRLHLVGVEKELNFLDLFQELGYLLPLDLEVRGRAGLTSLL
jgi:zinc finger MYND domain-containing protein 15